MIGAIIGDIVGSRFKYKNCLSKDFELFTPECEFTGNLVMMLAATKALTDGVKDDEKLKRNAIRYIQMLGRKYPKPEYGILLREWINSEDPKPFHSDSGAPAIWISAVPLITSDIGEALDLSSTLSQVVIDRYSSKGAKKAVYTTTAGTIFAQRPYRSKRIVRDVINMDISYNLEFTLNEIRGKIAFSDSHQDIIPFAVEAFLESNDFEDAIRNAVSVGGDSSTIAAVAGAFAEAYYKKVPPEMARMALSYLTPDLFQIYIDFLRVYHLPQRYSYLPRKS